MNPMVIDPMNPVENENYGCTTTKRGRALKIGRASCRERV